MSLTKKLKSGALHVGLAASLFAGFKGIDLITLGIGAEYARYQAEQAGPLSRFLGNTFMYFIEPEEKAGLGIYKHWTNQDTYLALGSGVALTGLGFYSTLKTHNHLYRRRRS